jgi:hypothetical protein
MQLRKQIHIWFALLASLVIIQGQLLGAWHEATHHGGTFNSVPNTHEAECAFGDTSIPHVELDQDHSTCPVCVLNQSIALSHTTSGSTTFYILGNSATVTSHFYSKERESSQAPRAPPVVRFV